MKNKTIAIGRFSLSSIDDIDIALVNRSVRRLPRSEMRADAEAFASCVYKKKYGAKLNTFPDTLLALTNKEHGIISVVGVNMADKGKFFLEQYLDKPIEEEISVRLNEKHARSSVVEVSTLSTLSSGLCRFVMAALTGFLMGKRKRFIAFTAVKTLRNTLAQLGIPYREIADATAGRLEDSSRHGWGTYYSASPKVIVVDIEEARANINMVLENVNSANSEIVAGVMNKLFFKALFLQKQAKKVRAA